MQLDYDSLPYPELKALAAARGVGGSGKKTEIIERLEALDRVLEGAEEPAAEADVPRETPEQVTADVPRETSEETSPPEIPKPRKLVDESVLPDPNHPGYPNWDMRGRWIRR